MTDPCLLFAYGLLRPGQANTPQSATVCWQDRVRASLVQLDGYTGAIDVGSADTWIDGYTLEIDRDELPALDAFENVDAGEYRRRLVTTQRGHCAWIYEYQSAQL